jgi:2-dehydro-3-deoxygalactonokinase
MTNSGRGAFLACDWGTTNLRAWLVDETGSVLRDRDFPLGVSRLGPGQAAARFASEVRPAMRAEGLPALMCGMIGSNLGWTVVPYRDCPADLGTLAAGVAEVGNEGPFVRIVPGLRCEGIAGAPDVMRGEETQILGWVAAKSERTVGRRVLCHPGTHAKWALVEDGRLTRFVTAMTGELFAVLGRHSVLKSEAPPNHDSAFDAGVDAAGDGGALSSRLFTARSRVVAGGEDAVTTPSYLSGLLIGAEIAAVPRLLGVEGEPVEVLGDPALCAWYCRALARRGVAAAVHDGEAAALSGLRALHQEGGRA